MSNRTISSLDKTLYRKLLIAVYNLCSDQRLKTKTIATRINGCGFLKRTLSTKDVEFLLEAHGGRANYCSHPAILAQMRS